jgi:hypothetical protein
VRRAHPLSWKITLSAVLVAEIAGERTKNDSATSNAEAHARTTGRTIEAHTSWGGTERGRALEEMVSIMS